MLQLAAGTNPKIVSEVLGHKEIAITLDRYSHGPAHAAGQGHGPPRHHPGPGAAPSSRPLGEQR
jgi:hypothetical protein